MTRSRSRTSGELDYGASAVSLPITNDAGLLQVSPGDGLTSLTRRPPGRPRAGPERYYPADKRNFVRVGPSDLDEAQWLVERVRASGGQRVATVFDREIYGRELAGEIAALARRDGNRARGLGGVPGRARRDSGDRAGAGRGAAGRGDPPWGGLAQHRAAAGRDRFRPSLRAAARLERDPRRAGDLALPAGPARIEAVGPAIAPERAGYDAMRLVLDAVERGPARPPARDRRCAAAARPGGGAPLALYRPGADGRFERVGAAR